MSQYFARSMMDLNSSSSHIGVPRLDLKKTLSHNDLSPRTFFTTGSKSDILSPRYFEDTPAPNSYRMKTTIGSTPGVSFKGDRKRNFDSARKEACFLLPNLVDDTPGPNAYNVEEKFGFGSSRASLKGRRSGPFQSNRGQMHITPQFDERGSRLLGPQTYDIPSSIGKTQGVSLKGDRERNFNETPRLNCGFLLPKTIEKTPGPGSYNIGSTMGVHSPSPSFKGSRSSLGPFQTDTGRTYIGPELSTNRRNDKMYDVPVAVGTTPGVSMKGDRHRQFDTAKTQNAVFLVPDMIDQTPAPGAYEIKSTIGAETAAVSFKGSRAESRAQTKQKSRQRAFVEMNTPGVSFKGDRTRRFDHLKEYHATFLLPAESNDAPAPGSYNIKTTIGSGFNGLKDNRVRDHYGGPFQGNSGPMYIKPEINTKDKTPGPNDYKVNSSTLFSSPAVSLKGRRLKSLFGEPTRPGPTDYTLTKANLRKTPMFTNRQKTKPSFPDSLNYTPKDSVDLPGPGSYSTRKKFSANDSPAYKIGEKLQEKLNENPAPNKYEYEKGVPEGPAFSMGKRFDIPDSRLSPGPATYSPQDLPGAPKYSMTGRHPSSKVEEGPGPNAYNLQHDQHTEVGTSLKSRASPYVYSGFQTNKFMEDKGSSTLAAQG
ncbi:uncharacterized protein LOC134245331 isoform X1 [Saccostrea cucullata]|uniref:uncharacterized protein LOC134245331 isoform X1 n=1 Tax=Saccostrea cuccullata TaxID=36930 RepID=UPI002ED0B028